MRDKSPGGSEIAIHREIPHQYRPSVDGNPSGSPWYEATHSGQAEAARLGRASGLVWPAGCWRVELAGLAVGGTKQLWLMSVTPGVEPALV
jgi:hypothetical protein